MRSLVLGLFVLCQPACQAQPPPTTPAAPPAEAKSGAETPTTRVLALLAALPDAKPVLGALSVEQRREFDRLLDSLSDQDREVLRSADNPIVAERPLLHLMAGGRAHDALLVLATTKAAARELSSTLASGDLGRVLSTTNEVIHRAALEWLRLAREPVRTGRGMDAAFCDHLDRVAATLGDIELRRAARELWVQVEDSPAARLNLARATIWTRDSRAARAQLELARQGPELPPRLKAYASQIEELLQLAAGTSSAPETADAAVELARSHLRLQDPEAALALLEPFSQEPHLGVATMRVISRYPDLPCPGVRAGLGDRLLCGFAMQQELFKSREFAALESAWQSKAGRSLESVQDYLGLAVVLPWQSRVAVQAPPPISNYARKLAEVSAEAHQLSPQFPGLALFGQALSAGAEASEQGAARALQIPPNVSRRLLEEAKQLAMSSAAKANTATLLGVAAVLSQHEDVRSLYQLITTPEALPLAVSQVALGTWLAAAFQDAALFESVKAQGISVLQQLSEQSLSSSTLVALLAEAANAIEPNADNRDTLLQVAKGLSQPGVPEAQRLRSALNQLWLTRDTQDQSRARQLLTELVASLRPAPGSLGAMLVPLARAHLLLTETPAPATHEQLTQQLASLRQTLAGHSLPPSVGTFQQLWEAELSFRVQSLQCRGALACRKRARLAKAQALRAALGTTAPIASHLLQRGVLTMGSLEISLDYRPGLGLAPVVTTEPMLVFVLVPSFE